MKRWRFGGLDAVVVGGNDGQGSGSGPVVVLLHGFGAPGTDLVALAGYLNAPPGTRFVFPAAPMDLGYGARAWWMIDIPALDAAMREGRFRDLLQDVPEGLESARGAVIEALDGIEKELAPPPGKLLLGGFSQGAMLSLDVALHDPRPFAGLALMSGAPIAEPLWAPRMKARAGLRVVQSHGSFDPLLPFAAAEGLRDWMTRDGLDVKFVPFRGAHEIPPVALRAVSELASESLAGA